MITAEFTNEINDLITENLYQWDTYQTLKITGINFGTVAPRVHFANKKSKEALVVNAVLKSDGSVEVSIPNSLLTEKYDILAYVYTNTGLTSKTIKSITIPIIARLKPSEYYQPTDEEIAEIEAIELEAKAIIDGLTAIEYNSTESYKRPNIVYYNQNAYMCKSNTEITGILPTDTTNWQEIVHGERISGVSVNNDGKLTFTTSSGNSYSINFQVKNVQLVDEVDIPALSLTSEDVDRVKNPPVTPIPTKLVGTSVTDTNMYSQQITKTGLYVTALFTTSGYYTDIIAIPTLLRDSISNSGQVKFDSSSGKIVVVNQVMPNSLNYVFKLIPVDADGKKLIYNFGVQNDEWDY